MADRSQTFCINGGLKPQLFPVIYYAPAYKHIALVMECIRVAGPPEMDEEHLKGIKGTQVPAWKHSHSWQPLHGKSPDRW